MDDIFFFVFFTLCILKDIFVFFLKVILLNKEYVGILLETGKMLPWKEFGNTTVRNLKYCLYCK